LLGRNQPIFGEPNDVGSEFREVGAAAGRWLYITGSYPGASAAITLVGNNLYSPIIAQGSFTSAPEPAYPIINAGTTITLAAPGANRQHLFLIKIDAVTGVTQWGTKYGVAVDNWSSAASDIAADPVTGNVYIAGTITNPDITTTSCNSNVATPCGVDAFNLGTIRKVGCPVDPRPVLSTKQCPATPTATLCTYGILNKERGLPYCNFVPLHTGASKTTGFVAAINDVWTDELGRTVALGYSSSVASGLTNVAWFKALGNGHGHSTGAANVVSVGSKLAIHDTDVIVTGTYSGAGSTTPLQFPGVHSLYQDNVMITDPVPTTEGLSSSTATGGFIAWLVD